MNAKHWVIIAIIIAMLVFETIVLGPTRMFITTAGFALLNVFISLFKIKVSKQ